MPLPNPNGLKSIRLMVSTYLFANKERRSATEVPGRQGGSLLSDQLAVFHLHDFGSAKSNKKKTRNLP